VFFFTRSSGGNKAIYGLDFDVVRFITDSHGKPVEVIIPTTMYSAMKEFWIAARRAQTASMEARHRPGTYKTSLRAVEGPADPEGYQTTTQPSGSPHSAHTRPANTSDAQWAALLERLPADEAQDVTTGPLVSPPASTPAASRASSGSKARFFAREFMEAPPDGVMLRVTNGVYFLRAWREHLTLTVMDVAQLIGCTTSNVMWHEQGHHKPSAGVLRKFAAAFDCPLLQLEVKPGTPTGSWLKVVDGSVVEHRAETFAPDNTEWPEGVMHHMAKGRSPMAAWRLYRGLSHHELADQYGGKASNVKAMEEGAYLRPKTIAKLCPILHCQPAQLMRPRDLPTTDKEESPASRRITEAALMSAQGR
jgi:transcriptional regulator with XRE-family HTH domain